MSSGLALVGGFVLEPDQLDGLVFAFSGELRGAYVDIAQQLWVEVISGFELTDQT